MSVNNDISFQWLFASVKKTWSFEQELKKTKTLSISNKVPSNKNYDHTTKPFIEDIELLMFPTMDLADVLHDMDTAVSIVNDLEQGISKPIFPVHVWDVSCIPLLMSLATLMNSPFPLTAHQRYCLPIA